MENKMGMGKNGQEMAENSQNPSEGVDIQDLLEEIQNYMVETSFGLRWDEIEMNWTLGKYADELVKALKNEQAAFTLLFTKTGKKRDFWELRLKFVRKYPDLAVNGWDKTISWSQLRKEFSNKKVKRVNAKEIVKKHLQEIEPNNEYNRGRRDEAEDILRDLSKEA